MIPQPFRDAITEIVFFLLHFNDDKISVQLEIRNNEEMLLVEFDCRMKIKKRRPINKLSDLPNNFKIN